MSQPPSRLWGVLPLLFFFGTVQAQEIPSSPTSPAPNLLPPQSLIGETHQPPKVKSPLKAKEIEFEVQVPPGSKVSLPLATRTESDITLSDYHFRLPTDSKKIQIVIEGPFGGKIRREFSSGHDLPPLLKISEDRILDSSNTIDPNRLSHLPTLCPRLVPKTEVASNDPVNGVNPLLSPETAVYDGRRDMLSMATLSKNIVLLEWATLTFDFEDPSVYVGASKNGEKLFEKGGGFYSNLNYFIFPFQAELAEIYRQMEPDFVGLRSLEAKLRDNRLSPAQRRGLEEKLEQHRQALFGKGAQTGPYQILMKTAFDPNRGAPKNVFLPPLVRGFIPGPFLGSTHWGYTLCEWGDTQDHGSSQKMQYKNYPLWRWPSQSADEKMILMIVEGDEQLKNTDGRREWIEKGMIRPGDYTDDLVGFFVVSRSETVGEGKILSSPVQELILKVRTP